MEKNNDLLSSIIYFGKALLGSVVIFFLFFSCLVHPVRVQGRSMQPTLMDASYGLTSVYKKYFGQPQRNEIVTIEMPNENGEKELWVKRIIGMPGDTIEGKNEQIYVNGKAIKESYLDKTYVENTKKELGVFNIDFEPVTLKEDEYFVMGDNRPYSKDSRYSDVGPIKKSQIFGYDVYILYKS